MVLNKFIGLALAFFLGGVARAEVVTEPLPALTPGSIGIDTVFDARIWGDKPVADKVIQQIRQAADIPFNDSEREILRQILLTDVGGLSELAADDGVFLKTRLQTLMAQGLFEDVLTLIDHIPDKDKNNDLVQMQTAALFALGRVKEACTDERMGAFGADESFLRVVCAEETGVPPAAAFAYEVYRESNADTHVFLNAAGENLYRGSAHDMPTGNPSIFELPLSAKAWGMDIFDLPLKRGDWMVLSGIESVPHEVRLKAQSSLFSGSKTNQSFDESLLEHLIKMAKERQAVEQWLPPAEKI
ncbi:MAG: hypothetical protein IJV07_05160 [Alphaproteobacteria bacterium]|nr:hypothetical protein [Alphaproteobacteria bacterium]